MPEQHRRQDDPEGNWYETSEAGGVWKWLAILLTGVLISLAGSYLAIARNAVGRDEAITLMQNYSPYNQDKGLIKQELSDLQAQNVQLRNEVNQLEIQMAQLKGRR